MNFSEDLRAGIEEDVTDFFKSHPDERLVYHNLHHTKSVVSRCIQIAGYYGLSTKDMLIVFAAAWFHDIGHLLQPAEGHEARSVQVMQGYFQRIGMAENMIAEIAECILSTQLPANPQTLPAQILCDADLYHLGTEEFQITNELVKQEIEKRCCIQLNNWDESSLLFLQQHHFHTAYCTEHLAAGKWMNIEFLQKIIAGKK